MNSIKSIYKNVLIVMFAVLFQGVFACDCVCAISRTFPSAFMVTNVCGSVIPCLSSSYELGSTIKFPVIRESSCLLSTGFRCRKVLR
jgi:hypothetical protein